MNRLLASKCPHCHGELIPAFASISWSKHHSDHCVRNVWSCETCGYESEHMVYFSSRGSWRHHIPYSEAS
jgi:C4-type Zn-finger protein